MCSVIRMKEEVVFGLVDGLADSRWWGGRQKGGVGEGEGGGEMEEERGGGWRGRDRKGRRGG